MSLRREILSTEDLDKAMKMIDNSTFKISTKNSLKCIWRRKHNQRIYRKRKRGPDLVGSGGDAVAATTTPKISIKIPDHMCPRPSDAPHLFVQKHLIRSQIELLVAQEKAIDEILHDLVKTE
jgi:hypothetical protein